METIVKKKKDYRNRKRFNTMVIRISLDQKKELYTRINLTGRKIQDYMYQSVMQDAIVIAGNETLRRKVNERLMEIESKLQDCSSNEEIDPMLIKEIRMIYELTETWI